MNRRGDAATAAPPSNRPSSVEFVVHHQGGAAAAASSDLAPSRGFAVGHHLAATSANVATPREAAGIYHAGPPTTAREPSKVRQDRAPTDGATDRDWSDRFYDRRDSSRGEIERHTLRLEPASTRFCVMERTIDEAWRTGDRDISSALAQ